MYRQLKRALSGKYHHFPTIATGLTGTIIRLVFEKRSRKANIVSETGKIYDSFEAYRSTDHEFTLQQS